MQLRTKIFLFFLALSAIVIVIVFAYLEFVVRKSFKDSAVQNLESTIESDHSIYRAFTEGLKTDALSWSSDRYIKNLSEVILDESSSVKKRQEAALEFARYLRVEKMQNDPIVAIVDLLNKDGTVVASSRVERIGADELKEEREHQVHHFSQALSAGSGEVFLMGAVFEDDESVEPMFHVTTRMFSSEFDAEQKLKSLDGVLLVHFVALGDLSDVLSHSGKYSENKTLPLDKITPADEMETYLVNKDGFMVTSTGKGTLHHVAKNIITSPLVTACLANTPHEDALEYLNHNGVSVIGASFCLKEEGIVIVTEIPTDTVYEIFDGLIWRTILIGLGVFVAILLFLAFGFKRALQGIEDIASLAKRVKEGDFTTRLSVMSKDELGFISEAFNSILDEATKLQEGLVLSNKKLTLDSELLAKDLVQHKEEEEFMEKSKRATLNLLQDTWKTKENLEVRERRLKAVLEAIPNGIILINRSYNIEMVNPKVENLFGFSSKELLGKDLRSLVTIWQNTKEEINPSDSPIERTFLTNTPTMTSLEDELSITTEKRPFHLPVTIGAVPLHEDIHEPGIKAVVVVRDMTRDRELDEARSGFISIASHQLRTPLTTIRWYAEMLLDEDVGSLSATQRDFLNEIHSGTKRLYETIDLLLGISRIENGKQKAQPQDIDVALFTEEIVKEFSPQSNEKGIVFGVTPETEPVHVWLDPLRLRQVLLNLISNAVRYTNKGGLVDIFWSVDKKKQEVSFSVRDNGIGIPFHERGRIFSKFFRAENAFTQAPDGSGLGLALVKEIVSGWGGDITFETEEGKGTTFKFTIPLGMPVTVAENHTDGKMVG